MWRAASKSLISGAESALWRPTPATSWHRLAAPGRAARPSRRQAPDLVRPRAGTGVVGAEPRTEYDRSGGTGVTAPSEIITQDSRHDAARPPDDEPFWPEGWDRYELVRELGSGGMGIVRLARDRRLGRHVALKFIRGRDPRSTIRLVREARAQARVDHPGICKIYEVGEVEGRTYIAMQFLDGAPLAEVAARASLHEKVALVRDVALALHEAHALGILHRDVKPANILVET